MKSTIPIGYWVETGDNTAENEGTVRKTVTNTYEEVEIGVKKVWDDDDNRDGKRTDITGVTMHLVAKVGNTDVTAQVKANYDANDTRFDDITLNGSSTENTWDNGAKWTTLPKYYQGDLITWTVEEKDDASVSSTGTVSLRGRGYTTSYSGKDSNNVITVTNRRNVERTVELTLTKNWEDAENQDGLRPSRWSNPIYLNYVQLYANGTLVYDGGWLTNSELALDVRNENTARVTLSGNSSKNSPYTVKFSKLPVNTKGQVSVPIVYKLGEKPIGGYTLKDNNTNSAIDLSNNTLTLTNAHTPAVVSVKAYKRWKHNGHVLDPIKATLRLVVRERNGNVVTLDDTKYDTSDKILEWTSIAASESSENMLFAEWKVLPKYEPGEEGMLLYYEVVEVHEGDTLIPDGYHYTTENRIVSSEGNTTLTILNEYEETTVNATKRWDDDNNRDGKRQAVSFQLYRKIDGVDSDYVAMDGSGYTKTISTTASGDGLTVSWQGLPAWIGNRKVSYDVREVNQSELTDYYAVTDVWPQETKNETTKKYTDVETITNKHIPETTRVAFVKKWDMHGYPDHPADSVFTGALHLWASYTDDSGVTHKYDVSELATNPNSKWPGSWKQNIRYCARNADTTDANLKSSTNGLGNEYKLVVIDMPAYMPGQVGKPVTYTLTEDDISGYTRTYPSVNAELAVNEELTNSHVTRDLTISKSLISDLAADDTQSFVFNVSSTPGVTAPITSNTPA